MTTTSWTTTADIPPAAWAALVADMRILLGVLAAAGTTTTNPAGDGPPELDSGQIGFTATAQGRSPLTVVITRTAGTGTVTTSSPQTTALVHAAIARASRYWGTLLAFQSDADTESRAMAAAIVDGLFGAGDRAVAGESPLVPGSQLVQIVARAQNTASATVDPAAPVLDHLDATIRELISERDGMAAAAALLTVHA